MRNFTDCMGFAHAVFSLHSWGSIYNVDIGTVGIWKGS